MNSKRGFMRITFTLAVVAALSGAVIGVGIIINEYNHAKLEYEVPLPWEQEIAVENAVRSNVPPFEVYGFDEMFRPIDLDKDKLRTNLDRWHKMSDIEKIAEVEAYNIKRREAFNTRRNELESGFWIQLSKPSLVALCVAGGLGGAFIGFCTTWLILCFCGLVIYKLIRWLVLGFYDDIDNKKIKTEHSEEIESDAVATCHIQE